MDTERGVLNTGVYWGEKGRASGRGRWGGIAWGEKPNVGEGEKKMWHIYTMEYYAAIKYDESMSFAGTWMKLETIILSKLTEEQKTKHCMFSLTGGC